MVNKVYSDRCGICLTDFLERDIDQLKPPKTSSILNQKIGELSIAVFKCGHAFCESCFENYKISQIHLKLYVPCPYCGTAVSFPSAWKIKLLMIMLLALPLLGIPLLLYRGDPFETAVQSICCLLLFLR